MDDDFRAQLAMAANLAERAGRQQAINDFLKWANANREALVAAGLLDSVLRVCGQ